MSSYLNKIFENKMSQMVCSPKAYWIKATYNQEKNQFAYVSYTPDVLTLQASIFERLYLFVVAHLQHFHY
jgi:hypothetical protein